MADLTHDGECEPVEYEYADWRDRLEDRIGGVEFRFAPMPWNWRLRWSKDDLTPFWWIEVGPFAMLLSLNFIGWKPPLSGGHNGGSGT
jgi:hypothetical protein